MGLYDPNAQKTIDWHCTDIHPGGDGGLVCADDVSGSGTYTEASDPPDPVPLYPTFVSTWYDDHEEKGEYVEFGRGREWRSRLRMWIGTTMTKNWGEYYA